MKWCRKSELIYHSISFEYLIQSECSPCGDRPYGRGRLQMRAKQQSCPGEVRLKEVTFPMCGRSTKLNYRNLCRRHDVRDADVFEHYAQTRIPSPTRYRERDFDFITYFKREFIVEFSNIGNIRIYICRNKILKRVWSTAFFTNFYI